MNYKDKYIKYKTKYLKLKNIDINNQIGGGKNIIIHISGFPGSGKTTLGEKIQKIFKNTIVYDTDGFIQKKEKNY
jgi:adenylylsulfate kinase-like enzyme